VTGASPFAEWRDELAVELAEAQQTLVAAADAMKEAEAAHDAAQAWHTSIRQAVAALHGAPAHALATRIRGVDEDLHETAGAMARARAEVAHILDRIGDLQQAARELALLMAPAAVEEQDDAA
jgi:chromosome segregation ATPase